ncbi:MAG: leucine-rich repeat domain-containing protein [Planctomycetes bacterium]|nr:leucine-rich repeat domain-containing protein [Planctomycetota bacterium]
MKAGTLLTAIFLILAASLASAAEPVTFADANLKAIVEKTLGSSDPTADDMLNLTRLYAGSQEIGDLGGLEHAKNLTSLCVHRNKIKDISPVANLRELTYLCIHDNQIEDISAVAGLKNLTNLLLYGNKIEDISPVAGLSSLASLYAADNRIESILAVAGLKELRFLDVSDNRVGDVSAIAGLTELTDLRMPNNKISDLSAVGKLGKLKNLWVYGNPAALPSELLSDDSKTSVYCDSTQYAKLAGDPSTMGKVEFSAKVDNFMVSRNKCFIRMVADDGAGQLPAGEYKLGSWEVKKKDKDGVEWALAASVRSSKKGGFKIAEDKPIKLDVGEPIVAQLSANKKRSSYSFSQNLVGRMGENISISRDGARAKPPKLQIKNKAGTYDKTFNFEYG